MTNFAWVAGIAVLPGGAFSEVRRYLQLVINFAPEKDT